MAFCFSSCFCLTSIQRADTTSKALIEILAKSSDYLQPNPTVRAKLSMVNTVSKMRGQEQASGYPHPEGLLGDSMIKYGNDLGAASNFGETFLMQLSALWKHVFTSQKRVGKLMFGMHNFNLHHNQPVTKLDNGTFEVLPGLTNPIFFCNLWMTGAEFNINHVNTHTHTFCLVAAVQSIGTKCTVPEEEADECISGPCSGPCLCWLACNSERSCIHTCQLCDWQHVEMLAQHSKNT